MTTAEREILGSGRMARLPDQVLHWSLSALLGLGASTLGLLVLGVMTPWMAWPLGALATVGVSRLLPSGFEGSSQVPAGILAIALALGLTVVAGLTSHEHVLGGRDPGTYVATATWAARSGSLVIPSGVEVMGETPLRYGSPGFVASTDDARVYPQFMHLFPGLLALAAVTFGPAAIFWVNPVVAGIALLALFGFARRIVGEWPAALACLVVALTLPFTYFARAPFSELTSMALAFGALWVFVHSVDSGSVRHSTGAGLLLGAVFFARIDGVLVILATTIYLTWLEMTDADHPHLPLLKRLWLVASLVAVAALVEGLVFSPVYVANHAQFVAGAMVAVIGVRVGGALFGGSRVATWLTLRRETVSRWVAGGIGLWLAYAWVVRPQFESPTKSDVYGIEALQQAAGAAVEPLRSYAELSVRWLGWYLGPVLLGFALTGMVVGLKRQLARSEVHTGLFLSILTVTTLTYLVRPSINPDQIWAIRRFLPLAIPGLVLLAVWLGVRVLSRLGAGKSLATLVLITLALVPVVMTTVQVGLDREIEGGAAAADQACASLGSDAAVVFIGEAAGSTADVYMPLLRGWCGITTGAEAGQHHLTAGDLDQMAIRVAAAGKALWIVQSGPGTGGLPGTSAAVFQNRFPYLELTLFSAPRDWESLYAGITAERWAR